MVDNTIRTLFNSEHYAYIEYMHPIGEVAKKFVYSDGKDLEYGDKAEILDAVMGKDFSDFIKGVLSETYFTREHYWFTFGYQPADYDNEEIKESEVRIHYAGVDNTISKKEFYDLCLLLCDAKLNLLNKDDITNKELTLIKTKLEGKLRTFGI